MGTTIMFNNILEKKYNQAHTTTKNYGIYIKGLMLDISMDLHDYP